MLILERIQEFETISMCGQIFRDVPQFSKKFQEFETTVSKIVVFEYVEEVYIQ
jgi:hypothetical protein